MAVVLSAQRRYLILQFRGRYFNDVRTVIASYRNIEGIYEFRTYLDVYPPAISLFPNDETNRNPLWLTNGSKIYSVFGYMLRPTGSVNDKGLAIIEDVSLLSSSEISCWIWDIQKGTFSNTRIQHILGRKGPSSQARQYLPWAHAASGIAAPWRHVG